ncbi:MAG: TAXI family TRAP transporter solute-binding subunit [Bacillota bacterium]|nr:TAXI family TRAP transporter solute-binding subunit [Bacillota bacterium]
MKEKKLLVLVLLLFIVFGMLSLVGCSPAPTTTPTEPDTEAPDDTPAAPTVTRVNMGSGWVTGAYYPLAGGMSRVIHNNLDTIALTVESSGASAVNSRMIGSGDLDMAIVQNDVAFYAYNGEGAFDTPITNIRGMFILYPEPVQLVAAEGSGINSPADLAGKRVALGPLGSGAEVNALQVLEAAGLTEDDLAMAERLEAQEAADYLKDGRLDAAFYTVAVGASVIADLAVMSDVYLVNIEGEFADNLIAAYPFYAKLTIEGDVYSGVAEAQTVSILSMVVCREDLPEELVYEFTKTIFENLEDVHRAHSAGRFVTLESALDWMGIPIHPGAERYFTEAGIM